MWTLSAPAQWQQEVKKSRFLARAAPVETVALAQQFVDASADADARHNCWAYRIGSDYRWSDGDEPAGTAGRPILAAIDGQQLDRVVVLVARWFGGIKLGAGGLVRAYGGTAAECLRSAPRQAIIEQKIVQFQFGFEWLGAIYAAIEQFSAIKLDESFDSNGAHLRVQVANDLADALCVTLRNATRGSIVVLAPD